ncbi:hypothetical protein FOZG_17469 [Fusarium oxysporum Fo47]|uniref:Uncharacterized protein n=1 Tax=Fusarium oxysporum Fo47 TaxID=660027 RepID=W9JEM9_FUSOX|nr:hypothetical protein FOZG_17469 [Fusarium oxysporum Fo47]
MSPSDYGIEDENDHFTDLWMPPLRCVYNGKVPATNTIGKRGPGRPAKKGKARVRNPQAKVKGLAASKRVQDAPVKKSRVTRRQTQTEDEGEIEEIVDSQIDVEVDGIDPVSIMTSHSFITLLIIF